MLDWVIPDWCLELVQMEWHENSQYVNGRWLEGNYKTAMVQASVQNPASNLREQNPGGYQDVENLVLFTNEHVIQLINQGQQDSVYFTIHGKKFFMTGWEKWNYLMPHYRITLVGQNNMAYPREPAL